MSNNITYSTEDIGSGVQLNRTKMVLGNSGTDDGDVSATNPVPVEVQNSIEVSDITVTNPVPVEVTNTVDVSVQGTVPVSQDTTRTTVINVASSAYSVDGNSGDIDLTGYSHVLVGINYTAKTGSGDLVFSFQLKGPDGVYYDTGAFNFVSTTGQQVKVAGPGTTPTTGSGCLNPLFTSTVRLTWDLQGPSGVTFSYWIIGIKG